MITIIVALSGILLVAVGVIAWCTAIIKWQAKRLEDLEGALRPPELVLGDPEDL